MDGSDFLMNTSFKVKFILCPYYNINWKVFNHYESLTTRMKKKKTDANILEYQRKRKPTIDGKVGHKPSEDIKKEIDIINPSMLRQRGVLFYQSYLYELLTYIA